MAEYPPPRYLNTEVIAIYPRYALVVRTTMEILPSARKATTYTRR